MGPLGHHHARSPHAVPTPSTHDVLSALPGLDGHEDCEAHPRSLTAKKSIPNRRSPDLVAIANAKNAGERAVFPWSRSIVSESGNSMPRCARNRTHQVPDGL